MKVPQARSRISIAPSMLRERKGRQAPVETTMDYPKIKSGCGMALPVKMSASQKRTLKKGGAITIKPEMISQVAEEALALLPASAKKIMNSIAKNKGIRYALKKGEDLVNRMTGKGLFEDIFSNPVVVNTIKKIGSDAGKPFEVISPIGNLNPFDLGYQLGHDVIGPALVGKEKKRRQKKKGGDIGRDIGKFFTKTIPSVVKGKVDEYKKNPQNVYADILDTQSLKIPIIDKNPQAIAMRGTGGKIIPISKHKNKLLKIRRGGSFLPAGGAGIYPAGKYGGMIGSNIDIPIQLGSPFLKANSPAMTPFIPTRGIQSSQKIM